MIAVRRTILLLALAAGCGSGDGPSTCQATVTGGVSAIFSCHVIASWIQSQDLSTVQIRDEASTVNDFAYSFQVSGQLRPRTYYTTDLAWWQGSASSGARGFAGAGGSGLSGGGGGTASTEGSTQITLDQVGPTNDTGTAKDFVLHGSATATLIDPSGKSPAASFSLVF